METFKLISATACFLGIVITALSSLYPSEKFSKQMKMIFSLIFIISIVRPFASGKINFPEINENISANEEYYSEKNEEAYDYFVRSVEENINSSLEASLNEINIYPANIQTSINISENGSISINEVKLVLDDLNLLPDAEKCIRNAAKSNVTVTAEARTETQYTDISAE